MSDSVCQVPPPVSRDELRARLRQKRSELEDRRTGTNLRGAKQQMAKKEKNTLMRDVRKNGVKALTKQLGIHDPSIEKIVAEMIRTGEAKSAEQLIQKINEIQAKQAPARELPAQRSPPSPVLDQVQPMPSLPSANPKRKTLQPLSRSLLEGKAAFENWMQAKNTGS